VKLVFICFSIKLIQSKLNQGFTVWAFWLLNGLAQPGHQAVVVKYVVARRHSHLRIQLEVINADAANLVSFHLVCIVSPGLLHLLETVCCHMARKYL